jgi:hypothetical protein
MQRPATPPVMMNPLLISTDESLHAADLAEQIIPGGAGVVQGLIRAKREALKGVSELIDANIRELEGLDSAIGDAGRPRWTGGIGRGLLLAVVKRVSVMQAAVSQVEATILQKISATLMQAPTEPTAGAPGRPERVKVE